MGYTQVTPDITEVQLATVLTNNGGYVCDDFGSVLIWLQVNYSTGYNDATIIASISNWVLNGWVQLA
jgi:hypothetical protein